jgi:2,5-dioxopentanoate dehydrogenase
VELHGGNLIGSEVSRESESTFQAFDPKSGSALDPQFAEASAAEVDRAATIAETAFEAYSSFPAVRRAEFLRAIAGAIEDLGGSLVERMEAETALPPARIEGERARTAGQLRMFADLVEEGSWVDARIDRALPDRKPAPRPEFRRMLVPLGPVAVFGASNFPLAFSVAGGDTASALAAGCTVVVKAHAAHPGTSELVARALLDAAKKTGMPDGVFSMVHGRSNDVGLHLVTHSSITAVGFTGSLKGGRALFDAASRRDVPIPVYAEMGSTNPVFVLPGALAERGAAIAESLASSVTLAAGQMCTNPGLVPVERSDAADRFVELLAERIAQSPAGTMVASNIKSAYEDGLAASAAVGGVRVVGRSDATGPNPATDARAALLVAEAETFARNERLSHEVFGPATLAVTCGSREELIAFARSLQGQLTATVHGTARDLEEYADLLAILRRKVGRLVIDGVPTGVEVCSSTQHGGPYPATTDSRSTSVGSAAIYRFARPLAYQNAPESILPEELRAENPRGILRLVDGVLTREAL